MVGASDFSAMAWALGAVRLGALGWVPTGVATARAMVVAVDSLLLTAAGAVFAARCFVKLWPTDIWELSSPVWSLRSYYCTQAGVFVC